MVVGINTRMIYLLYDDGSRSEKVILNELGGCKGIIQSDGYSPYRKLESDAYPHITRIPCLQHIKRKFIDCGEDEPDAKRIVELINTLYQNEHKHKIGVDGWTVEQNLVHRKKYAPDILGEIKDLIPYSRNNQKEEYRLHRMMLLYASLSTNLLQKCQHIQAY